MFGKNLESACKAYHHRQTVCLEKIAANAAEVALSFVAGSPEWKEAVTEFVKAEKAVAEHLANVPA